jgi:hypothetical protein
MKTQDIDHTALDLIRQGPAKEVKRPITNTQPEIDALTVRLLKVKEALLLSRLLAWGRSPRNCLSATGL